MRFLSKSSSVILTSTSWPNRQDIRRFWRFFAGDLADVDQTVHTGMISRKALKVVKGDDFHFDHVADIVIPLHDLPGIVPRFSCSPREIFFFSVSISLYIHFQHVAHFDNLGRMFDLAPAQLGDVDHAVHAAQIDECAVIGQGFDNAVVLLADLYFAPELILQNFLCSLRTAFDRGGAAALAVDFQDFKLNLFLSRSSRLSARLHGCLGGGDEHLHPVCRGPGRRP